MAQGTDKRQHLRFPTRLRALYYMSDEPEGLEKCDIINVGHGGFGIQFNDPQAVKDSSAINLGIVVKWQFMPISLQGTVRWLAADRGHTAVGGIELAAPLDNMTLLKLL